MRSNQIDQINLWVDDCFSDEIDHHDNDPYGFSAAYLRCDPERMEYDFERIQHQLQSWQDDSDLYCEVGMVEGNPWIEIYIHRFEPLHQSGIATFDKGKSYRLAQRLSLELKIEMIAWFSLPAAECFAFWRIVNGNEQRALVYGLDLVEVPDNLELYGQNWELVAGQPEPWEDELLFSLANKQDAMRYIVPDLGPVELVEHIWAERKLVPGHRLPMPPSHDIAVRLGLPGFVNKCNDVQWLREVEIGTER